MFCRCLLAVALAVSGLFAIVRADAAPDNTRGMAIMAAAVAGNNFPATLTRGSGAVGVTNSTNGNFVVQFDRDITNCFWYATLGNSSTGAPSIGYIRSMLADGATDSVLVQVFNTSGNPEQTPFMLQVFCNK